MREFGDRALDLSKAANRHRNHLDTEQRRDCLGGRKHRGSASSDDSSKDRYSLYLRHNLRQQLQPLRDLAVFHTHKTGQITARTRQALNKPGSHWVGHVRKHDRQRAGRLLENGCGRTPAGEESIGRKRHQFLRQPSQPGGVAETKTMIDAQIASYAPAQFLEPLHEGTAEGLALVLGHDAPQNTDAPHALARLCPRRDRPTGRCAANNLHEITPSHCRLRSKTTLFGIQLPSSKQKIASSETGLNAQCAMRKSGAAHVSDGSFASLPRAQDVRSSLFRTLCARQDTHGVLTGCCAATWRLFCTFPYQYSGSSTHRWCGVRIFQFVSSESEIRPFLFGPVPIRERTVFDTKN